MMRSFRFSFLLALALATIAGACSSPSAGGKSCPNDLPSACPADVPSYAHDVAPIVSTRCLECHVAGGAAASRDLSTYDHLYANRSAVLNQVYGCVMPPSGASALDDTQRATLLAWLVCHAPNN